MFVAFRALTYALLFAGLLLFALPLQLVGGLGVLREPPAGAWAACGTALGIAGLALAAWCVAAFVTLGRGTPAPFDPPRRLVVRGPYRFVRNPMYAGATLLLVGHAIRWRSWPLLAFAVLFLASAHLMVLLHEEPALRRSFGEDYAAYCRRVGRWWPQPRATR